VPEGVDVTDFLGGQMATAPDGIHHEMFFAVDLAFVDYFVGMDEYNNNYLPMFDITTDNTYRGICEYYGITKEEYTEFWEEIKERYSRSHLSEIWSFEETYPIETKYDEWFSDDYNTNSVFFSSDYKAIKAAYDLKEAVPYISAERSPEYTLRYYTIDAKLTDYVGEERFQEYLLEAEDVNILSFIGYFNIDREIYMDIYEGYRLYPYNPEYLFSAGKSMAYFAVHPLKREDKG